MKVLKCEMCGNTDLIKQDGFFVCRYCGVKYSIEEARKMMIEGTVDVTGTVKVDRSDELKNLYQAARNAREAADSVSALKHYDTISAKDPNSWEAIFYSAVLKTENIKNAEIASSAINVSNSLPTVFRLIKEYSPNDEERKRAVKEVVAQCIATTNWLTQASHSFYNSVTKGNGLMALTGITGTIASLSSTGEALIEDQNRCVIISNIMLSCAQGIENAFGTIDSNYKEYLILSWKRLYELNLEYKKTHNSYLFKKEFLDTVTSKIKQYDTSWVTPQEAQQEVRRNRAPAKDAQVRGKAITGMILGIVSAVFSVYIFGVILGIVSLVLVMPLKKKYPGTPTAKFSLIGMILSFVGFGIAILVLLLVILILATGGMSTDPSYAFAIL